MKYTSKEMRDQLSKERASSFAAIARLQAKIDALMLEHCPDDMTEDQIKNWEKHQKPVFPNV